MRCFAAGLFALALVGCTTIGAPAVGLPSAPVELADQTVLDEQAALSVELAYQAAGIAIRAATAAGVVRGETATRIAELDQRAYRAVLAVRAAYDAGNAQSYAVAAAVAQAEIVALLGAFQ